MDRHGCKALISLRMTLMAESSSSAGGKSGGGLGKLRVAGFVLLLVAGWALLDRYTDFNAQLAVPLLLGVIFTGWSIVAKEWGLLVPGGILIGIGSGMLLTRVTDLSRAGGSGVFMLCFAAGWLLITFVSAAVFKRRVLWPLIPGLVMAILGAADMAGPEFRQTMRLAQEYWPWALLTVAAWLLLLGGKK